MLMISPKSGGKIKCNYAWPYNCALEIKKSRNPPALYHKTAKDMGETLRCGGWAFAQIISIQ
jgi:RNA:NAD 2'-phosphotransferase (TPT1/KptA family)